MPKYLLEISYSGEGAKGLLADGGSARVEAARRVAEAVGGRIEAFYFAFGHTDAYVIGELPDEAAAAAVALTVSSSGTVSARTVVLIEPSVLDRVREMTVPYRAPGA